MMQYNIFISYKRKSLPTANNLYYRLTTRGYSTFFDMEEMGRDNFNVQLLNYIENAKDMFVILEEGSLDACKNSDCIQNESCQMNYLYRILAYESSCPADSNVGIYGQHTIPTFISMLFFWPVLITQIWGPVEQSSLDDRALAAAERAIAGGGQSQSAHFASTSSATKFCTSCGARISGAAKFCSECGAKLI